MKKVKHLPSVHALVDNEPQKVADQCCIPVVWTDHQVTRRQRLHGCNIPGHRDTYTSTHMCDVLEHLAREGWVDAILVCERPNLTHVACYIEFERLAQ